MSDEHDGFCCSDCRDAAVAGKPSGCAGGACGTGKPSLAASPLKQGRFAIMAGGTLRPAGVATLDRDEPIAGTSRARIERIPGAVPMASAPGAATGAAAVQFNPFSRGEFNPFSAAEFNPFSQGAGQFNPFSASAVNPLAPTAKRRELGARGYGRETKGTGDTGCACQAPTVTGAAMNDPMAMKVPGRGTGAALPLRGARSTGSIYMGTPPFAPATEAAMNAASAAVNAWLAPHSGESAGEARERGAVLVAVVRRGGETQDAWIARLARAWDAGTSNQKRWITTMGSGGWLPPPISRPAATQPHDDLTISPEEAGIDSPTTAPASAVANGMTFVQVQADLPRRSGESVAGWYGRVAAYVSAGTPALRMWLASQQSAGRLPSAGTDVCPVGGLCSRAGGTTMPGPTPSSADSAANTTAVGNAVVAVLNSAGGTALGLVREANQHDSDVRAAAAATAAATIARNDSREQMLVAAVREATNAGFDAQTAMRTLRAGDRMTAIAQLSAAQGRLAAAVGTAAAFPGSSALSSAIATASTSVAAAGREIDTSAPVDLPLSNPLNNLSIAPPPPTPLTPWYQQPLVIGAAVVGVLAAVLAGKKR